MSRAQSITRALQVAFAGTGFEAVLTPEELQLNEWEHVDGTRTLRSVQMVPRPALETGEAPARCLSLLVRRGADGNARDLEGQTAAVLAAQRGEAEKLVLLAQHST